MAGIGFRLEKMLKTDTYFSVIKSCFYSTVICSGPWIVSVLTIFCLNYFAPPNIDGFEMMCFRTSIVYVFALSLIVTGILYLSLNRYLADKLFIKDKAALLPTFTTASLFLLILQAIIGFAFFYTGRGGIRYTVLCTLLYMTVSMLWLILIFLTALRDYQTIAIAFIAGAVVTVLSCLALGRMIGLEGYLTGYLLGHFLTMIILAARIFIEFPSARYFDSTVFTFLSKHKVLVIIGVLYNTAVWIDKIVFWASPHAVELSRLLRTVPLYETAVFFSYLTIIPALSIFLIHVETNFYRKYNVFYTHILEKSSYPLIKRAKTNMVVSIRAGLQSLVTYQGIITILVITFAADIIQFLGLPYQCLPLVRITSLGAFLHGLLLVTIIIILYFDFQKEVCIVTAVFCVLNGIGTYITTKMSFAYFGYGYFIAALISLVVAFYCLDYKLSRLEYLTFASQPIGLHREEEIA